MRKVKESDGMCEAARAAEARCSFWGSEMLLYTRDTLLILYIYQFY